MDPEPGWWWVWGRPGPSADWHAGFEKRPGHVTLMFVLASMVVLSILTVQFATTLNQSDVQRIRAEQSVQVSERRFRALIENSTDVCLQESQTFAVGVRCRLTSPRLAGEVGTAVR
jgi:hypothetical protein